MWRPLTCLIIYNGSRLALPRRILRACWRGCVRLRCRRARRAPRRVCRLPRSVAYTRYRRLVLLRCARCRAGGRVAAYRARQRALRSAVEFYFAGSRARSQARWFMKNATFAARTLLSCRSRGTSRAYTACRCFPPPPRSLDFFRRLLLACGYSTTHTPRSVLSSTLLPTTGSRFPAQWRCRIFTTTCPSAIRRCTFPMRACRCLLLRAHHFTARYTLRLLSRLVPSPAHALIAVYRARLFRRGSRAFRA